ncbi:MAG: macro domain-containing protein [Chloroflexota bacterium]
MNEILVGRIFDTGQRLQIVHGDITQEPVDAIVNAANAHLQHGGGVAAVIVRRGGSEIQRQSNAWVREHGRVTHEQPAVTTAGNLPCRYVIHAVGPVWGEGDEDAKLSAAVDGSLRIADELQLTSLAFPAISTGIFGFPKARAAGIIFSAVQKHFEHNPLSGVNLVRLVLYDQPTIDEFLAVWNRMQSDDQ